MNRLFIALILGVASVLSFAQSSPTKPPIAVPNELYSTSNCMGCHGQSAMGGLGPPIAKTKLDIATFMQIIRKGRGMMPATTTADLSDADAQKIFQEILEKPYQEDQVPLAFKVSQVLTTRNVGRIFLGVFVIALLLGLWRLEKWVRPTGIGRLWPQIKKFGVFKSATVVLVSLIVDGFLVASLWKDNKHRWFMHGLMLYGFCGLLLADILMAIYNPARGDLPFEHPLKALPIISGLMLLIGIMYVMYRYRSDQYIDNGLTLSGDFLFVNLMFHSALAGFLTLGVARMNLSEWVLTIYIYHLIVVALLILTAPFSRFQHAWVVPILASITRLTEAVSASGVEIGFDREPSPGRHHKSQAIVDSLMESLGPDYADQKTVLRYFP